MGPGTLGTIHARMFVKNTVCTELLRDVSDLFCKLIKFINHPIDGILSLSREDTLHRDGDLMGQVTTGGGITDANDVAHLSLHKTKFVYCTLVGFKCGIIEWTGWGRNFER